MVALILKSIERMIVTLMVLVIILITGVAGLLAYAVTHFPGAN